MGLIVPSSLTSYPNEETGMSLSQGQIYPLFSPCLNIYSCLHNFSSVNCMFSLFLKPLPDLNEKTQQQLFQSLIVVVCSDFPHQVLLNSHHKHIRYTGRMQPTVARMEQEWPRVPSRVLVSLWNPKGLASTVHASLSILVSQTKCALSSASSIPGFSYLKVLSLSISLLQTSSKHSMSAFLVSLGNSSHSPFQRPLMDQVPVT